jgi:SAM-dependent methyltransferase
MDEADARAAFESASNAGTREERKKRNLRWREYFDRISRRQTGGTYRDAPLARRVTGFLAGEGMLGPGTSVLDIGAGTGRFAIPFSRKAERLTALDMCEGALAVLRKNIEQEGIDNIETRQDAWEDFTSGGERFDLVFTAMCPAICNQEELLKMESLSKGSCAILTVSRGSHSRNRRALRMLLSENPLPGLSVEVNLFYDLLYAMGRRPGVLNYPGERITDRIPSGQAEELLIVYYGIFGFTSERDREIIRNFVRDNQSGGILEDLTCLSPALVFWQVPGGEQSP